MSRIVVSCAGPAEASAADGDATKMDDLLTTRQLQELLPVSYTHLRAPETVLDLVCRLLLEKKKQYIKKERMQ